MRVKSASDMILAFLPIWRLETDGANSFELCHETFTLDIFSLPPYFLPSAPFPSRTALNESRRCNDVHGRLNDFLSILDAFRAWVFFFRFFFQFSLHLHFLDWRVRDYPDLLFLIHFSVLFY